MTVTKHAPQRIRIETTINHEGRPDHLNTRVHLDGEDISSIVTGIDLTIDAKNPKLAELAIRHENGILGNYRPLPAFEPLLCVGCFLEVHAGQRQQANHAALIVGGNSTCTEHLQIGPAPQQQLPDRTQGGIIIPGGPINGGH